MRLKKGRRNALSLEAHQALPMPEQTVSASVLRPTLGAPEELAKRVQELFTKTGTKPGRVSLVLPDNLAKVSLLSLPEKPASSKQLDEIVRFKMKRAVPFRLEEASMAYQVLEGGDGQGCSVLVILLRKYMIEQYEQILADSGAQVGLVDLSTTNVFNLCRDEIATASAAEGDVALLNCTPSYFSMLIGRNGRLIFYRCKSYAGGDESEALLQSVMSREIATSLSYYREKLEGQGIRTVFVRSTAQSLDTLEEILGRHEIERVELIDPSKALEMVEGMRIDPVVGQRMAPAIGAAAGR